jgi:hypothetical protein
MVLRAMKVLFVGLNALAFIVLVAVRVCRIRRPGEARRDFLRVSHRQERIRYAGECGTQTLQQCKPIRV